MKTRHGERPYQDPPSIADPAEFGSAFTKWWNAMQPAFRQAPTGIPKALWTPPTADSKDSWAVLQRAGPNGMVTVVTMLFWWGRSLNTQSRWQDDSTSAWKGVVNDVARTLRSVKGASGPCSKKRRVECTGHTGRKR